MTNTILGEEIIDGTLEPKKTTFMTRKNIAEQTKVKDGVYVRFDNGQEANNPKYRIIDELIPLIPNATYTMNHDVQVPFFDGNGNYVSGIAGAGVIRSKTFTVPSNVRAMKANILKEGQDTFQIELGFISTEYESPQNWKIKTEHLPTSQGTGIVDEFDLYLPPVLYVTPGMTIELYNNQVCWTGNIENYHFKWSGQIGSAYARKWSLKATNAMKGTHDIELIVYDINLKEVAKAKMKVIVGAYTFSGTKTILNIGDSLSNTTSTDKPWYGKVRQLTSKIKYVGTRGLKDGEMHEGRSGFSAAGYLSEKAYPFEGEGVHPFWNPTTKKFDYQYYIDKTGIDADGVQIFLGTNGIALDPTNNAHSIKKIVDSITKIRPNNPIFLVHTIYRSNQDGIAKQTSNDGYAASSGVMKLEEDKKIFNLMKRLYDLLKGYNNVVFVPLAHCHDSENNFGSVAEKVNPRSDIMSNVPKESIHPQYEGYIQFADVFFCMYNAFNDQ